MMSVVYSTLMKTLQKPIQEFSFFARERGKGKTIGNKCGRDFLYYALNFYLPDKFNALATNPKKIDDLGLFGVPTPAWLAWTQVQFANVAHFLRTQNLKLCINDKEIQRYFSFVTAILFSRKEYVSAIKDIEQAVDNNEAVGVDISLGLGGLLDHVLFVYGYDDKNLYVFDTHKANRLEYESVDGSNFYFQLPKSVVESRWTRFGRVWSVKS